MIENLQQWTDLVLWLPKEPQPGGAHFLLKEPLAFGYTVNGEPRREFVVPRYFRTDLASVPGPLRGIISVMDMRTASVAHDFLYETKMVSRKEADAVFLAFAKKTGDPWIKRNLAWLAVRLFGKGVYDA